MNVNITGAGITGLSAVYYLLEKGHKVTVFESHSEVGGSAGFFRVGGSCLE